MKETVDTTIITNISEFERNKPVITIKKFNDVLVRIDDERIKTEILYKERITSLDEIKSLLYSIKDSYRLLN
jgi:predicted transcriptional regulator